MLRGAKLKSLTLSASRSAKYKNMRTGRTASASRRAREIAVGDTNAGGGEHLFAKPFGLSAFTEFGPSTLLASAADLDDFSGLVGSSLGGGLLKLA